VGKRSQQAELERNNDLLARQTDELKRQLIAYREIETELEAYKSYMRRQMASGDSLPVPGLGLGLSSVLPQDDDSHDAALLLNLKQGHEATGSGARASPAGRQKKLGDILLHPDQLDKLWAEYFANYHMFLTVLDPLKDTPDAVFEKSSVLFWTVVTIAARHYDEDSRLLQRLAAPYMDLVRETISRPPSNHYVVKALCLLCTWPLPVSSTTADMTFPFSGVMMKFAMQLGLHRPSHPMDFSRERVQLREEDISDRLQTWAICNLVAQNISTGYGQPPETVYDVTLNTPLTTSSAHLRTRLEIEKLADKITRTVYTSQQQHNAAYDDASLNVKAAIMAQDLQRLESSLDLSDRK
jgi:hypothetical protein